MPHRHSKIVATLGPGSRSPDTVRLLAEAGVNVFRLNFSHGNHDDHARTCEAVRAAEARVDRPLAVLADLQGPKVRVGRFPGGEIRLGFNAEFDLVAEETTQREGVIPLPHAEILRVLEEGDRILCNDGLITLDVIAGAPAPRVRSPLPGKLSDKKGFTVRGKALPVSALTDKDEADLAFAMQLDVDFVALSFVQTPGDVETARALITNKAPLIAKLEKPAAMQHLDEIIAAADGVMVARGDLGVEFPAEQVPIIQRRIVRRARAAGKPVIVATQMLESMVEHAAPTRAEASDVASAIYQGADAVMLSAETAVGRHPATAVAIMSRIISATESAEDYRRALAQFAGEAPRDTAIDIVADAAFRLAETEGACALALRTGSTRRLARFARRRGTVPVLYGSNNTQRLRRAALFWGVNAYRLEDPDARGWAGALRETAGLEGRIAWSAWKGEDEGRVTAWEIGLEG
ncbi:MAG: pyruvate kinase [Alphaproteobacteria bacterium]|nr:pyruvate kinase [Alphaproteobacteria bacterium]